MSVETSVFHFILYNQTNMSKELVSLFRENLLTDRSKMDAERITVSDEVFGRRNSVSITTVIAYMGNRTVKLNGGYQRIDIDVERANKLRELYNDQDVGEYLGCNSATLSNRCGSRKSLGLPLIRNGKAISLPDKVTRVNMKNNTGDINRRLAESAKRELKQDRWETKVEKPYWDTSIEVQLYNRPHPFLYQKLA